jgi:hypothetical protein
VQPQLSLILLNLASVSYSLLPSDLNSRATGLIEQVNVFRLLSPTTLKRKRFKHSIFDNVACCVASGANVD